MRSEPVRHVVYDADCAVCRAFRRWAKSRDRHSQLAFVPNDDPELEEMGRGVDPSRAVRSIAVVMPNGKVVWGARAIFETVGALPGMWGSMGSVLALPPLYWLAEPFYRLFARNRGRFARFVRQG